MRNRFRGRPSPATVIALTALVLSMAGTATAAKVLITSSAQIKKGVVTGGDLKDGTVAARDIKPSAVTGDKIRNGSIGLAELESSARSALLASETQALEAFRKNGPEGQPANKLVRIATLGNIPPGVYALFAKTIITSEPPNSGFFDQGETVSAHCVLDAGGDKDEARALLGTPGALSPAVLNMQITRSFGSAGTATLECDNNAASFRASDTSIIAIRVGKAPRSPVEG